MTRLSKTETSDPTNQGTYMNINMIGTATAEQGHGIIQSTNGEQNQMFASRREERTEDSILIKIEARFSMARCEPWVPYSHQCKPPANISTGFVADLSMGRWEEGASGCYFAQSLSRAHPGSEENYTGVQPSVRYEIYYGCGC